jgi:hypothetical protein
LLLAEDWQAVLFLVASCWVALEWLQVWGELLSWQDFQHSMECPGVGLFVR